ncbi:MAG: hypothetical protein RIS29_3200 [Bacteroidota bacterium]|jgi:hypothetical protein
MKTTIYLTIILICSLWSCTIETLPDEELTMNREPYTGNSLRINGFYKGAISMQNYYEYLFLYSNGVTFYIGYKDVDSLILMSKDLETALKKKDHWGVFQISNNSLYIQQWGQNPTAIQYILYNHKYEIVNDSTLFFKNSDGDSTIYHFIKYSPKPDSTNTFIK